MLAHWIVYYTLRKNFNEILIGIQTFSLNRFHLKSRLWNWLPFFPQPHWVNMYTRAVTMDWASLDIDRWNIMQDNTINQQLQWRQNKRDSVSNDRRLDCLLCRFFRWWLGAVRQQAITWANVDRYLCRHIASLGHTYQNCLYVCIYIYIHIYIYILVIIPYFRKWHVTL